MTIRAYTVFDNKGLIYNTPFFAVTDGVAVRMFQELANDPQTSVGRHPGDYSLWCCGTYDEQTGELRGPNGPLLRIVDAVALVQVQPGLPIDRSNPPTDTAGGKSANGLDYDQTGVV